MIMFCKISPRMSEDLPIGRMIGRFHSCNTRQKMPIMARDMFYQIHFGAGRAGDEYFTGLLASFGNRMKEILIRVMFFGQLGMMRVKRELVGILRIEVKNLRFFVVDPDNGMKMRHSAHS